MQGKVNNERLDEKYRPKSLDQVIAQDRAITRIRACLSRSWGGRAYWLSGPSGTGKTTIARILATMQADRYYITETVARQLSPVKLRNIIQNWAYYPLSEKQGHALIVNESHGLSKPMIEIFLDVLENLSPNVLVIFTTTKEGNDLFEEQVDSSPFKSRCLALRLASRNLCGPFAIRAKEIARIEHLDGQPIEVYENRLKKNRNNLRAVLSEIESGRMLISGDGE